MSRTYVLRLGRMRLLDSHSDSWNGVESGLRAVRSFHRGGCHGAFDGLDWVLFVVRVPVFGLRNLSASCGHRLRSDPARSVSSEA